MVDAEHIRETFTSFYSKY